MSEFDLGKLNTSIIYLERMAEGKNPATNQQVDNEVLDNPNVIRCLHFVRDILLEVRENHGLVGKRYSQPREKLTDDLLGELLEKYQYRNDKPISHVIRQIMEPVEEEGRAIRKPNPTKINQWLEAQGYIIRKTLEENGKQCWFPTSSGEEIGLYSEKRGFSGNEYNLIMYSERAQRFLIAHLGEMMAEKNVGDTLPPTLGEG